MTINEDQFRQSVIIMRNKGDKMDREGEFWSEEERQYLQSLFDNGTGITAMPSSCSAQSWLSSCRQTRWTCSHRPVKSVHTVPESPTACAATANLIRHSVPVISPLCPFRRYLNAKRIS